MLVLTSIIRSRNAPANYFFSTKIQHLWIGMGLKKVREVDDILLLGMAVRLLLLLILDT